jgi:hypothetical protein
MSESASRQNRFAYVCEPCDVAFATRQKLKGHVYWTHDAAAVEDYGKKVLRSEYSGTGTEPDGDVDE